MMNWPKFESFESSFWLGLTISGFAFLFGNSRAELAISPITTSTAITALSQERFFLAGFFCAGSPPCSGAYQPSLSVAYQLLIA